MVYIFFGWAVFFSSLSLFLREKEVRDDVHMERKKKGVDRVLEILAAYPVILVTVAFSFYYIHIPLYYFVPAYLLIGGVSRAIIVKVLAFEFWIDKKQLIDVISVISGGVMLFILLFYNI